MAGLVPAIHDLVAARKEDVDARHKAGHDEERKRGCLKIEKLVIPGRAASANPESRNKLGACCWIPDSRVSLGFRNDKENGAI